MFVDEFHSSSSSSLISFIHLLSSLPLPNAVCPDLLYNVKKRVEAGKRLDIATQVAVGLSFLHDHNIAHLDLKPSNILVADGFVLKVRPLFFFLCFELPWLCVVTWRANRVVCVCVCVCVCVSPLPLFVYSSHHVVHTPLPFPFARRFVTLVWRRRRSRASSRR